MKRQCTFKEATVEDLQEILNLLEDDRFLLYIDFLVGWADGEDQVGSHHGDVVSWMKYAIGKKH